MTQQIGSGSSSSATLRAEFTLKKDDQRYDFVDAFLAQVRAKLLLELAAFDTKGIEVEAGLSLELNCEIRTEQEITISLDKQV